MAQYSAVSRTWQPQCHPLLRLLGAGLLLSLMPLAVVAQTQQSACPAEVVMTDSGSQFNSVNFSFDNRWLVFIKNGFLHSVPTSGGPFTVLNPDKEDLVFASIRRFTPDSRRVIYLTTSGQDLPDDIGIFSVPIDGSEASVTKRIRMSGAGTSCTVYRGTAVPSQ